MAVATGSSMADTKAMKLTALLLAVLTVFLQMHSISARGEPQCMAGFPCPVGVCCNSKNLCGVTDANCGPGCQSGPCTGDKKSMNEFGFPDFVFGNKMDESLDESTASFVTAELFDKVFPNRDGFYSFEAFVVAAKAFPEFGTVGGAEAQKRDVAAFFAHVHHETAGLTKTAQKPASGPHDARDFCCMGSCLALNPSAKPFSCAPGKKYFARGPLKLTWNYNYGSASQAIGADILAQPDLLTKDATLSFKSALWVWMTPENQPSGHAVMTGTWSPSAADIAANRLSGFGATIDILEGHAECGKESSAASSRSSSYLHITKLFDVDAGAHLECSTMLPFN
ncbi:unnamed protein product [Calypogeia fissa]